MYNSITFDIFNAFPPGKWKKWTVFLVIGRDCRKALSTQEICVGRKVSVAGIQMSN